MSEDNVRDGLVYHVGELNNKDQILKSTNMLEWFDMQYQREKDDFIDSKLIRESSVSLGNFNAQDSR